MSFTKIRKTLVVALVLGGLTGGTGVAVNAETPVQASILSEVSTEPINLSELDLTTPHVFVETFVDGDRAVEFISEFEPDLSRSTATVGTWRTTANFTFAGVNIISQTFRYDLSRSGTSWRISNGRDHLPTGFARFDRENLSIGRATSTASFPAEITASVRAFILENQWVTTPFTANVSTTTTVTNGGVVRTTSAGW